MAAKQGRRKHVPQRTCVICREKTDKRLLTRVVRTPDQRVVVDPTGKRNGRGAYLCQKVACWDKALMGKVLDRALQTEISPLDKQLLAEHRPVAASDAG